MRKFFSFGILSILSLLILTSCLFGPMGLRAPSYEVLNGETVTSSEPIGINIMNYDSKAVYKVYANGELLEQDPITKGTNIIIARPSEAWSTSDISIVVTAEKPGEEIKSGSKTTLRRTITNKLVAWPVTDRWNGLEKLYVAYFADNTEKVVKDLTFKAAWENAKTAEELTLDPGEFMEMKYNDADVPTLRFTAVGGRYADDIAVKLPTDKSECVKEFRFAPKFEAWVYSTGIKDGFRYYEVTIDKEDWLDKQFTYHVFLNESKVASATIMEERGGHCKTTFKVPANNNWATYIRITINVQTSSTTSVPIGKELILELR